MSSSPPATFRTDINGLRAYAVLAVMLYHFGVPGFGGGFIGVDVFFVISGFLMTRILIESINGAGGGGIGNGYGTSTWRAPAGSSPRSWRCAWACSSSAGTCCPARTIAPWVPTPSSP